MWAIRQAVTGTAVRDHLGTTTVGMTYLVPSSSTVRLAFKQNKMYINLVSM